MGEKVVELDERRRVALGRIGQPQHRRYLVREEPDGTLIWEPATLMSEVEAAFLRNHPDVLQRVRENRADPDPARRKSRPLRRGKRTAA